MFVFIFALRGIGMNFKMYLNATQLEIAHLLNSSLKWLKNLMNICFVLG